AVIGRTHLTYFLTRWRFACLGEGFGLGERCAGTGGEADRQDQCGQGALEVLRHGGSGTKQVVMDHCSKTGRASTPAPDTLEAMCASLLSTRLSFLDRDHSILSFNERVMDWARRAD